MRRSVANSSTRNPERTRARILAAALQEFSAKGFAGARVDAIARRARVNKRMLYHYFGDKEALFRAILRAKLAQHARWLAAAPADPAERLRYWFARARRDPDWVRLLEWEALQQGAGPLIGEAERRGAIVDALASLREFQSQGLLAPDLDPPQTLLSMMALTTFPLAFPQLTRLVTGCLPTSLGFRRKRLAFLRAFARRLRAECDGPVRLLGGAALALTLALVGCSDGSSSAKAQSSPAASPQAVPVSAATAVRKTVPVQLRAVGNVQALSTVSIKSQINGQLMTVHFHEGQDVKEGELLFTIDPRPLQAALQQAEANVARDQAQARQAEANSARDQAQAEQAQAALAQARAQLGQAEANVTRDRAQLENARAQDVRYTELVKQGYVAREQYDQIHTALDTATATLRADEAMVANARAGISAAEATLGQARAAIQAGLAAIENAQAAVRADQAAVESARLQLGYTEIRSPLDGRTGTLLVQPGNLVKANDVPILVTIAQVHPIFVAFSIPEQYLRDVRKYMAAGPLQVEAVAPGEADPLDRGQVSFVDNTVDVSTGTIQLKATFPNAQGRLWPGQFVNVRLTLTSEPNVVVVPSQAVQTGQNGQYVFVVKPDDTVEPRPVSARTTAGGEVVIDRGVQAGERVVTDGQLRLAPGVQVEIRAAPAPAPTGKTDG
jgi:multidrug efflux system membrane fusion protein